MTEPLPLRLGPVTLGYPRISVVALLEPTAAAWTSADWELLREAGVSVAGLDGPRRSVAVPVVPRADLAVGADPQAPGLLFLDTEFQVKRYPDWARTLTRPWGPLFEGKDAVALGLAAVAAGAPLVGLRISTPGDARDLVNELKALAGVLGRELTRIPKPAEGTVRTATGQTRYAARAGSRVAFQGEHGAYSEMAVFNLFPHETSHAVPLPTFREVFSAVLAGEVDFSMVPIENALAGPINENYDLLREFPDLHIVGETQVRVEHNLIGLPGTSLETLRKVLSHPKAWPRASSSSTPTRNGKPFRSTTPPGASNTWLPPGTRAWPPSPAPKPPGFTAWRSWSPGLKVTTATSPGSF